MDSRGRDERRNRKPPRGGTPGDFRASPPGRGPTGGQEDIARDSEGNPLVDRFGRPVRNRPRPRSRSADQSGADQSGGGHRAGRPRRSVPPRRPARREQRGRGAGAAGAAGGAAAGAGAAGAHSTRFDPAAAEQPAEPRQAQPDRPRQHFPQQQPQQRRPSQPPPAQQPQQYAAPQQPRPESSRRSSIPPRRSGPRPSRPPRPPRRRRRWGCLRPLLGVLAIFLVFTLVVTLWADSQLNRTTALPEDQISDTAGTNWLLVGSDSRQGLSDEEMAELGVGGDLGTGRTDTVMLLHIPLTGSARLVSLPRDSYVQIPGYGMNKLNAAFTFGGPQLLSQTVEGATGLHIDHYAEIGMGGLANIVNSVGGIEMCVEEPIRDPMANLDVQAGCQEFDGPTALGYVRTRATAGGDLDRVERQRQFFSALLDKVTNPGTLLNPFRLVPLISDTASTFTVGEGDHVWHLARVALAMSSGVEAETVPFSGFANYAVGSVVLWDEQGAEELFSSMR